MSFAAHFSSNTLLMQLLIQRTQMVSIAPQNATMRTTHPRHIPRLWTTRCAAISQAVVLVTLACQRSRGHFGLGKNVSPGLPSKERTPSLVAQHPNPSSLTPACSSRPLAPALSVASSPVLAQPSHPIQTPRSSSVLRPSFTTNKPVTSAPRRHHWQRIPSPHPSR